MPITGNASYVQTMNEVLAHWLQCNNALPPATPLRIELPNKTLVTRGQFEAKRDALLAQNNVVQAELTNLDLARGIIELSKANLLERFNQFTTKLDGKWQNTHFHRARPYAPGLRDGQENFSRPMGSMMTLWAKINDGPAPSGVTLPLVLPATFMQPTPMTQGELASQLSALQFAYADEDLKDQNVVLARAKRDEMQDEDYVILKAYRENVPSDMMAFPTLVETMPRLSPLPGHTPDAVNSSAVFEAPDKAKVVYNASDDLMLAGYQLRGNVGTDYSDEDAVVIATNDPGAPREFVTTFGLNQPGVHVALKVYVILTTGNEAGSAAMFVQRPLAVAA